MHNHHHRVRFAPSPSGRMHLGNIRAAVLNYLCARQHNGTFILRIEDTDQQRTFAECYQAIYDDLDWLNIVSDEGPYFQSKREDLYKKYLDIFIEKGHAYRCFATSEQLDRMRQAQIACKIPPRYDRKQCKVSEEQEVKNLKDGVPFIWRCKLPASSTSIHDKARGQVTYDLKNFADFPLTRQDGSFTFLFANFVDDVEMKISYIIRGEDHMSNTALQSAMYDILHAEKPLFYHIPIICNKTGQKLSKRDFGFSLKELIDGGYIAEAILNYLILLGSSFEEEIFSLKEAAEKKLFDRIKSTGTVQYDIEKLSWINKKWLQRITTQEFIKKALPFLRTYYPDTNFETLPYFETTMAAIQKESSTFKDVCDLIKPFINQPQNESEIPHQIVLNEIAELWTLNSGYEELVELIKKQSLVHAIPAKELWRSLRLSLTGSEKGLSIKDIVSFMSHAEIIKRIAHK